MDLNFFRATLMKRDSEIKQIEQEMEEELTTDEEIDENDEY